jgi:hypothetical protein
MSHKLSLACAGAFLAAATLAGISPALSHTIVGNRVFPATLAIDDPGVNDELALPSFAYAANPDNSNEFDYRFAWQKTITYDLSFTVGSALTHLVNTDYQAAVYCLTFDIVLGALVLGASAVLGITMPPQ